MPENLIPTSLDVSARQDAAAALDAAASLDAKVDSLTEQVAGIEAGNAARVGLPTTSTSVQLPDNTHADAPIAIVNLPAGTSVQLVVDVTNAFPDGSALEVCLAGEAIPISAWRGTPPDPNAPGTYATAPIGAEEALLLTRRGIITASVVTSAATTGEARITVHHPPVRRGTGGILNVNDWGVLPENDSATNTTNLYALRDWCRARPDTMHHIAFPPSEDVYWINRSDWLRGIRQFRLSGYGAKIGSDDGSLYKQGARVYTLVVNDGMFHDDDALVASPERGHHRDYIHMGHLINTVAMGQRTVTLVDGGTFAVGDQVLLYGLMQQGNNEPPNPRYFEYNQIRSISDDTLTMEVPLRHTYREDWPEDEDSPYVFNHGRARILKLNRPDYNICERCVIEGVKFWPRTAYGSRTADNGYLEVSGCLNAVVRDCEIEKFIPSESRNIVLENCTIKHYNEQDKIVTQLTYRHCRFSYLNQGWGVEQLTLDGCEITNFSQANGNTRSYSYARRLRITDCTFLNGAGSPFHLLDLGASVGKEIATIEGNTFHAKPGASYGGANPMRWVGTRWVAELPIVAQTDDGTKTTSVELRDNGLTYLAQIREGDMFIYADDSQSTPGRVTKLYEGSQYDGTVKRLALDVETNTIFMGGTNPRLAIPTIRTLSIRNNMTLTSDDATVFGPPDEYFSVAADENFAYATLRGTNGGSLWVFGYVTEVVFDVIRPYSGSGVNPDYFFQFFHQGRPSTAIFSTATKQKIVLSMAGLPSEPIFEIRMEPRNMSGDLPDNNFERPFIKVRVKTVPPRVWS